MPSIENLLAVAMAVVTVGCFGASAVACALGSWRTAVWLSAASLGSTLTAMLMVVSQLVATKGSVGRFTGLAVVVSLVLACATAGCVWAGATRSQLRAAAVIGLVVNTAIVGLLAMLLLGVGVF